MNSAGFGNNSFICSANFQLIGSSELNSQHLIEQPNSLFDTKNDDDFPTLGGIATNETDKTQTKTIQQKSFANIAAKAPAFKKVQSILKTTHAQTSSLNYPPNLSPSLNLLKIDDTTKNSGLFKFNDFTNLNKKFHDKAENNSFAPLLAKSRFDDLFERDPYLNHMRNVQEDVLLQIREISSNENFIIPKYQINEQKTEISTPTETPPPPPSNEWTSVVSRRRKASLNTEYSSHRPSPFTDDGYMEDYSDENESGFTTNGFDYEYNRTDSPSSSIALHSDNGIGEISGGTSHLDNTHIFYRTHICIFWQNWNDGKGPKCRHGEDCFYAHGSKKLRKLNPIYYKTVLCEKFNNGDICPYGENCNFAHGRRELREFRSRASSSSNINANKETKKFFSVAKRYHLRKQRGIQTIQCNASTGMRLDKVKVLKTDENEKTNNKKRQK